MIQHQGRRIAGAGSDRGGISCICSSSKIDAMKFEYFVLDFPGEFGRGQHGVAPVGRGLRWSSCCASRKLIRPIFGPRIRARSSTCSCSRAVSAWVWNSSAPMRRALKLCPYGPCCPNDEACCPHHKCHTDSPAADDQVIRFHVCVVSTMGTNMCGNHELVIQTGAETPSTRIMLKNSVVPRRLHRVARYVSPSYHAFAAS